MMDNVDNGAALAVYAQDGGVAGMTDSAHSDSHLHPARRQHCRCDEQRRNASLGAVQPLLCCLPMIAYGLGYPQGVRIRTQVQADIAAGKRKARKKANKERKQRAAQNGPEQLN